MTERKAYIQANCSLTEAEHARIMALRAQGWTLIDIMRLGICTAEKKTIDN